MKGAKKRARQYNNKEDGTYSISGQLVEYKSGYQFSFVRDEAFEQLTDEQWDMLTEYLVKETGNPEHIGVFCNKGETSFWTPSKSQANKYAAMFNQESILDWKAKAQGKNWQEYCLNNKQYDESKELDYDKIIGKIFRNKKDI